VPGGGPSVAEEAWTTAKHPTNPEYRKPFLVDVKELSRAFRKRYLMGLRRLVRSGSLKLDQEWSKLTDAKQLDQWCCELKQTDWNVFIEGPPKGESHPEHVLKYLTRYLSGGPIQDGRIISDDGKRVTFWARSKNKRRGNLPRPFELRGIEFVRRWAMHILPKGFIRARRYGGYHPTQCRGYLQKCRQLLAGRELPEDCDPTSQAHSETGLTDSEVKTLPQCPHCQIPLRCIQQRPRPSWKQVFEVEVYRSAAIYCPTLHLFARGPPS